MVQHALEKGLSHTSMLVAYTDATDAHLPKEVREYIEGLHRRYHKACNAVTKETKDNLVDALNGPPAQEKGQGLALY